MKGYMAVMVVETELAGLANWGSSLHMTTLTLSPPATSPPATSESQVCCEGESVPSTSMLIPYNKISNIPTLIGQPMTLPTSNWLRYFDLDKYSNSNSKF